MSGGTLVGPGHLRPWCDRPLGWLVSQLGGIALSSFPAYVAMLHSPLLGPRRRAKLARLRARAAYAHARRTVPAYRDFLRTHGAFDARRFEQLPVMSKQNYIREYPLRATLQGGRWPRSGAVIDESSGSSGAPTQWVRGSVERAATQRLIQYSSRATVGGEYILLNAFALGPWATGMNVSMAMVETSVVKSVGPDIDKLVHSLDVLGPEHRYVICGYPPFLKLLADDPRVDWDRYSITAVVGGEGMSEELRGHLGAAFSRVISSFGASDLEINLALESDWSVALRQRLADEPALLERLIGRRDVLPMVFQYDPTQVFIESGEDDHLLFTLCRRENVSPRIRYDLEDCGRVQSVRDVYRACHELGVDISHLPRPRTELPVLLHWGREQHAVSFFGCNVVPEQIQAALMRIGGLGDQAKEFALRVYDDDRGDKRLEVVVELMAGAETEGAEVEGRFFDILADLNQDFRTARSMLPAALAPRLTLEPCGESRLSHQDARIKKRYVLQ